jgi:hypothetical protein
VPLNDLAQVPSALLTEEYGQYLLQYALLTALASWGRNRHDYSRPGMQLVQHLPRFWTGFAVLYNSAHPAVLA